MAADTAAMQAEHVVAQARAEKIEIILDLSRLLSRALHPMPTGVDRVEMAYARELLNLLGDRLQFAAVHPLGMYGRLDRAQVLRFLDTTERRWTSGGRENMLSRRWFALRACYRLRPRRIPARNVPRYYIQASPNHLHREHTVAAKIKREGAAFICLVHDLIPIDYPEYARPGGAALHRRRMDTLAMHAHALIAISEATALSLRRYLADKPRRPPITVAHLGTSPLPPSATAPPIEIEGPYFVVIGTIEPRKNHLMLLNIWRRMIELNGIERTPHLVIIGRRGWENENVIDMLERCAMIQPRVHELAGLSDQAVATLLAKARALLMPSFVEGFGMPVSEALAAGVPVICSDASALREAGGDRPEYLDPNDGTAWMEAVTRYSADDRLREPSRDGCAPGPKLPTWQEHLEGVFSAASGKFHGIDAF